jgi:hypothetical protein
MALDCNRPGVLRILEALTPWVNNFASLRKMPGTFTIIPAGGMNNGLEINPGLETMWPHWNVLQIMPDAKQASHKLSDFCQSDAEVGSFLRPLFQREFGDRCTEPVLKYAWTREPCNECIRVTIAMGRCYDSPHSKLAIAWRKKGLFTAQALWEKEEELRTSLKLKWSEKYYRRGSEEWASVMELLDSLSEMPSVSTPVGGDQPTPIADDYSNFIFGEPEWYTDLKKFLQDIRRVGCWDYLTVYADSHVIFHRNDTLPDFLIPN